MKTKIIKKFQRWAKTVFAPSLEQVHWKTEGLHQKVDELAKRVDLQFAHTNHQMTALLFDRWCENVNSLHSRAEFGYWLNFLGLFGQGVEIGVFRGEYSEYLLRTWEGRCLFSVDPWEEYEESQYDDICNVSQTGQDDNYEFTANRLGRFGDRSKILRKTSAEAAKNFDDESLDFVYIDAQHHYEAVREDIRLWESKVKPGGIIGGHDYLDGQFSSGLYGVIRAVDEWSRKVGSTVIVTREGPYPSWFTVKKI